MIGYFIRQYLARAALSLTLAMPLTVAPVLVASVLPGQQASAVETLDCSLERNAALCREVSRMCAASPQLCSAVGNAARKQPGPVVSAPVAKSDASHDSTGPTIPLDPPSVPPPARPAELDAAAQSFLTTLPESSWQFTGDYFALGPLGLTSPAHAEFSVVLTSLESMLSGAAAGEITFRIYRSEADANRFYDAALHSIDADAISHWNIAVEGSPSPVECLAAVQAANASDWVPFELQRAAPAALVKSKGAHDWARCYARRGARVVIATIVLPHKNDNPIPISGPSPTTLQAAANAAIEAVTGKGQARVTNAGNK